MDLISRQAAIDALNQIFDRCEEIEAHLPKGDPDRTGYKMYPDYMIVWKYLHQLPSAEPERDKPKRVLWTGWKGYRLTRYNCPNCKKPVRNDDVYCHRCGQRLMFPKVSHTPYVEGQKQEVIVRWDDEG